MKRIFPLTIGLFVCITVFGQAPQLFHYQGVMRQPSGEPVANKKISLRISILDGTATSKIVYTETQSTQTNGSGMYTLAIGSGNVISGSMKAINWGDGNKFISIGIDTDNGNRYTSIGTSQLLSVPFALYAASGPGVASKESLGGTYWETTGNSGTTPVSNFIGTTDNAGLVFKTNNELSGFLDPITSNVAMGTHALFNNKGRNLVAIGDSALYNQDVNFGNQYSNTAVGSKTLFTNTTGAYNTAVGFESLTSATNGNYNTAIGSSSMRSNTYASHNTAAGYSTLSSNTTGAENTAIGSKALGMNTTGVQNVAIGVIALGNNSTGSSNTVIGAHTLYNNTTGGYNTATGFYALPVASTAYYNVANGPFALYNTLTGGFNVGIGYAALANNNLGSSNTAIGFAADVSTGNLTNATAIGYYATVDASNKVRIGNSGVTSIGGQVGWTTFSDGRYKTDVQENIQGLDFILRLRPVSYLVDKDGLDKNLRARNPAGLKDMPVDPASVTNTATRHTGFIAQEVEIAAKQTGFSFSGVDKPATENGTYGLRYAEFVVPLVKAVQEQQAIIEELKKEIAVLKENQSRK
jgi:trimeric autotransporter adhesin